MLRSFLFSRFSVGSFLVDVVSESCKVPAGDSEFQIARDAVSLIHRNSCGLLTTSLELFLLTGFLMDVAVWRNVKYYKRI